MTAPALAVVAGWEPGLARGATGSLAAVLARLPAWRSRVEALGRDLESASCWSGPAAGAAAEAVVDLSAVVAAVSRACGDSLDALQRVAGGAARAQALAAEAVASAVAAGVDLGPDGRPVHALPGRTPTTAPDQAAVLVARAAQAQRAEVLAEEAIALAARAVADGAAADDALGGLGVVGAAAPATFDDVAALVAFGSPAGPPALPGSRRPAAVAAWWAGLSAAGQRALIAADPAIVGGLDGLPGWARDRANRILLGRALADPTVPGHDVALTVVSVLAGEPDAALLLFSPRTGRVAVALGDVDTAGAVGVLVPGISSTVTGDLGALVRDAGGVADAARAAAPGLAVATIAWLGYRAPQGPTEIVTRADARIGGRLLDDTLQGLAAARTAAGAGPARTTVLAHSYGTVVVDEAADRPGRLDADAVALLGSPGMGQGGAAGLEAPEVYQAAGGSDPVPLLGWFGQEPQAPGFDALSLPVDSREGHGDYYDPAHPTLAALGRVVAGAPRTGEATGGTAVHPQRSGG